MKTAREFLEKEFHAFGDDELQLYITLNPDVRRIISAMENYAKQKLLQHGVSGKRQELIDFIKWVGDGYDFVNTGEKIIDEYLAACASGAVDTVAEGRTCETCKHYTEWPH